MGIRDLLFVGLIAGGAAALAANLYPRQSPEARGLPLAARNADLSRDATVTRLDRDLQAAWQEEGVRPSAEAPEITLLRRISLALTGAVPSLEEHRALERLPEGTRAVAHLEGLLNDRRYADYLAERLARAFVGTEDGPFLVFRRRRFASWLSDRLLENRPYDAVVRELLSAQGLWTDRPATNFVTVTYDQERKVFDAERLAGRVSRAFLGNRIDCAQCHDHPFQPWKQADFQGLAAFFGQTENGFTGLHEVKTEYQPTNRKTGKPEVIAPRVPFRADLLPAQGSRRDRLARWVTHPQNHAFAEATVNRVWALMFGRPLVEPVDDLGAAESRPAALATLAADFTAHGYDLRRLVRLIAASRAFRLDSRVEGGPESEERTEKAWAAFPMTRLRPEQVVGSIYQAASLTTLDGDQPVVIRAINSIGKAEFVQRHGDSTEDEFDHRGGTIPQRLLLMNGKIVTDKTKPGFFSASTRIARFAPTDEAAVDLAYLTTLCRQPTREERTYFSRRLKDSTGDLRKDLLSDLVWALVNATEFGWNH